VRFSAGTISFFLDGNKLGPGVQLATICLPVTKMRISGAIPHSSYTPSWCSQTQIYILSPRTFLVILRCILSDTRNCSSDSLPLSDNYEKSTVGALQQVVLYIATHLFAQLTSAVLFRIPRTITASSRRAKVIT